MRIRSFRPLVVVVSLAAVLFIASPSRAAVYGGIEIGAKGVKATVVDANPGADGLEVNVLMSGTQNTTLVAGLAATGRFKEDALKNTAAAVAKYAEQMKKEYKVPAEHIYIVGSSGLFSAIAGRKDDIKTDQELLGAAVSGACNLPVTFITVEREVALSIAGAVPAKFADSAVLLDVGSGNTKGGYRDGDKGYVTVSVPFGSVTFADAVKKRAGEGNFAESAAAARTELLVPAMKKTAKGKPELSKRDRVYLTGGAVWAMATLVHPGERGAYVALTKDDVEAYRKLLLKTPGVFPEPDLSAIADEKVRSGAQAEIKQVKKVFTPDQLLAGAEILKAMTDELGLGKDKIGHFTRNGNIAWIVAYVTEKGAAK
jgi:exopolyphosphatase/pppGpp-phosphohydrolase